MGRCRRWSGWRARSASNKSLFTSFKLSTTVTRNRRDRPLFPFNPFAQKRTKTSKLFPSTYVTYLSSPLTCTLESEGWEGGRNMCTTPRFDPREDARCPTEQKLAPTVDDLHIRSKGSFFLTTRPFTKFHDKILTLIDILLYYATLLPYFPENLVGYLKTYLTYIFSSG